MMFVMVYVGFWLLDVLYIVLFSLLIVIVDILLIFGIGLVFVLWGIFVFM